ncbi:MAG: histidine kinase [Burkholderiales bacterium]|nr:MAG: histidine kinase [Burkholderiales bacterium]
MQATHGLTRARSDAGFFPRVLRALDWRRLAAAALVALLLSLGALVSPALWDFLSPAEVALAWLEHLLELGVIAAALLCVFVLLDEALPRTLPLRLGIVSGALLGLSAVLSVLLHVYYAGGVAHLPPLLRMLADSLRWGLPAVFLVLIADVHRRALQAASEAQSAQLARSQLEEAEGEQRLALLQAQIEPHFLFNVLGNVRRLYRTRPQDGAQAVDSLMQYLRTAFSQLRSRHGSLGDEIAVVQAYVDLFRLRMGGKLDLSVGVEPGLRDADFPPMLLMTLVENAIKHGLQPAGGGRIEVLARRNGPVLEVSVQDDGVGFGAVASSGTGVGLANLRRQLAARYGNQARLTLQAGDPRGARATISLPFQARRVAGPGAGEAVADTTRPEPAAGSGQGPRPQRPVARRNSIAVAGLLAFAAPLTYFVGALSVVASAPAEAVARLGLWWLLYGAALWCLLLAAGHACERWCRGPGRYRVAAMWLAAACSTAALANASTLGRVEVLLELGLVHGAVTAQLYAFASSLVMALLYFFHLRRSRAHERAAARLAAAQAAQRESRFRLVQARLQELRARVDPQFLYAMLDTTRSMYQRSAAQGERFLDALIAFLRSALPQLRTTSSSLARELDLARAFVRLHALAGAAVSDVVVDVDAAVRHARLPPGVLTTLLEAVVAGGGGPCRLSATRTDDRCRLTLRSRTPPSDASVAQVRSLLGAVYGASGRLEVERADAAFDVIVEIPHEFAR